MAYRIDPKVHIFSVDYDERNARTDEAIEVIKLALTQDEVAYVGSTFRSRGTTMRPRPKRCSSGISRASTMLSRHPAVARTMCASI